MHSIMQMLQRDLEKSYGDGDRQKGETLEVIIQCLSEVYEVQLDSDKYRTFTPLETLFERGKGPLGSSPDNPMSIPTGGATPADMVAAEEYKRQGNDHMKAKEFEQAITAYTKAIELNDEKSEYYSNRAAAFSKMGQYERAIDDCVIALGLKEDYARAHGRLGFAYYQLGKHLEAKRAYKRAIELEPDNVGYKHNLESLEQALKEKEHPPPAPAAPAPASFNNPPPATGAAPGNAAGFGGFGGMGQQPGFPGFGGMEGGGLPNLGGMDMGALMNNPSFMNMATQMMSDPNMMSMATQLANQMSQSGVNPMTGLMGNQGFFPPAPAPPPPNQQQQQQQQPPPNNNNDEKKDEKKDKKKEEDKK